MINNVKITLCKSFGVPTKIIEYCYKLVFLYNNRWGLAPWNTETLWSHLAFLPPSFIFKAILQAHEWETLEKRMLRILN